MNEIDSDSDLSDDEIMDSIDSSKVSSTFFKSAAETTQFPSWSKEFNAEITPILTGDRIRLPQTAISELLSISSDQLPHPLVFEILNSENRAKLYASVREFTAPEGTVQISQSLSTSLGINQQPEPIPSPDDMDVTVEPSTTKLRIKLTQLPKCTFCKFAPLDPDYLQIPDFRASFESHLRQNYTTITVGETISVPYYSSISGTTMDKREIPFLVSELKPADACLVIDTDMEVDIVPLEEDVAKEAVKRKFEGRGVGSDDMVDLRLQAKGDDRTRFEVGLVQQTVECEKYRYYRVAVNKELKRFKVTVTPQSEGSDADVFVSFGAQYPTVSDHGFAKVDLGESVLEFDVEQDDEVLPPFLYVGVRGYAEGQSLFSVKIEATTLPKVESDVKTQQASDTNVDEKPGDGYEKCDNCRQWIPGRTFVMHHAFCLRNNKLCLICDRVMKKEDFPNHWHCGLCEKVGTLNESSKHQKIVHTPLPPCTCGEELYIPTVPDHRANKCPDRLIICRYCHLQVKAGPESREARDLYYANALPTSTKPPKPLSEHESSCGARTIKCTICSKQVQLKMVSFHMNVHKTQLRNQSPPVLCSNMNCARVLSPGGIVGGGGQSKQAVMTNSMGLCSSCFTPFWSPRHDPTNQKVLSKVAEKYQLQMTKGCEKEWCYNKYCASSHNPASVCHQTPLSPTDAAVHLIQLLQSAKLMNAKKTVTSPKYYFCMSDRAIAQRRVAAETILSEIYLGGGLSLDDRVAWSVRALEESKDDVGAARKWLHNNAPPED